jgi:hypothetical protein
MPTAHGLTTDEKAHYDEHGYVRLDGFAGPDLCRRMLDRVVEVTRARADGTATPGSAVGLVLPEANLAGRTGRPEELAAKVFSLHRDEVFAGSPPRPRSPTCSPT